MAVIPGYVPQVGERDLQKMNRAIRNLYEGAALASDVTALDTRLTTAESDIDDLEAAGTVEIARKANVIVPHENLVIKRTSATQVDLDADALILFDTNGNAKRFTSVNETIAITSSGANGLDTGSEANSTWYYIHGIGKSDGTFDGLLSTSSTSPTLPSGYTYSGLVGAIYNNSSGNLVSILQRGTVVWCTGLLVLNAGTQTSYTAVSLTAAIPSLATEVTGYMGMGTSSGSSDVFLGVAPEGSTTTATYGEVFTQHVQHGSTNNVLFPFFCLIDTAQQIKYYVGGVNARANITVTGWKF